MKENPLRPGRVARGVLVLLCGALVTGLVLAGCAGGEDTYAVNEAAVASRALPIVCEVPHAPDSLVNLRIVENEDKIAFELDRPLEEIHRAWSSTWSGGDRLRRSFQTYATLQSLEVAIASLEAERGVQNLSKALAQEMIRKRRRQYRDTIRIDLYLFTGPAGDRNFALRLGRPGVSVWLQDDQENEYEPIRIDEIGPIEGYFAGRRSFYRHGRIYFDRFAEGKDLLTEVPRLELFVQGLELGAGLRLGSGFRTRFAWTLP